MEISVSLDPAVGENLLDYINQINIVDKVSFHCDVMDGKFVERSSVSAYEFGTIMRTIMHRVDVHLMVSGISNFLSIRTEKNPRSISFHPEAALSSTMANVVINQIKCKGVQAGVVIDLDVPVNKIDVNLLKSCDVVTIMTVKAGKSGQTFNKAALDKIKDVKKINPKARIIVDGGINQSCLNQVKSSGGDTAVIGSYIYEAQNKIAILNQLLNTERM